MFVKSPPPAFAGDGPELSTHDPLSIKPGRGGHRWPAAPGKGVSGEHENRRPLGLRQLRQLAHVGQHRAPLGVGQPLQCLGQLIVNRIGAARCALALRMRCARFFRNS